VSKLSEQRREVHGMDLVNGRSRSSPKLRHQLFNLRLQKRARRSQETTANFPQTRADIARLMHHNR